MWSITKKTVHAPDTIMEMEHDHIFPIPKLTRPLCPWDFGSFQQTLVLLYSCYQLYGVQFTVSKWMAPTSYISLPLNRTKWHMAWAEDPKYLAAYSKASAVRVWCWICGEDMVLFLMMIQKHVQMLVSQIPWGITCPRIILFLLQKEMVIVIVDFVWVLLEDIAYQYMVLVCLCNVS